MKYLVSRTRHKRRTIQIYITTEDLISYGIYFSLSKSIHGFDVSSSVPWNRSSQFLSNSKGLFFKFVVPSREIIEYIDVVIYYSFKEEFTEE